MVKLLAISGSLRRASSNTALLQALAKLAPDGVHVELYRELGVLPIFNPDLEGSEPSTVLDFRRQLKAADGLIFASPEYAHGITGVLKNALDWVVASGETVEKPTALLNASPRATIAYESLREILITMASKIVPEACLTIPLPHNKFDEAAILAQPEFCRLLRQSTAALAAAVL